MGEVYRYGDPDFFDAMTPFQLTWLQASVRETRPGWNTGAIVMGDDPTETTAPAAVLLYIAPGQVLRRHAHDCFRVEVVIQGSVDIGDRILYPGDVSAARPGKFYGPHAAGPDGCLSVEIFSAARGLSGYAPDDAEDDDAEFERQKKEVIERAKAAIKDQMKAANR
jgi:hypothetical protein